MKAGLIGRRGFVLAGLGLAGLASAGCMATGADQVAALSPTASSTAARARQSRRFETSDRALMLQASLGALQDLGFSIDESDAGLGVIVGSKVAQGRVRAQVTVREAANGAGSVVRATFQRIVARPGAMLSVGETLDDPALYQGFFERVAQSAFLTANEI